MIRLFYVSTASEGVDHDAVAQIAREAELKNAVYGVTGALGYNGTSFAQILEGDRQTVSNLVELILSDPRHSSVTIVNIREIESRRFDGWGMKHIEDPDFQELLEAAASRP